MRFKIISLISILFLFVSVIPASSQGTDESQMKNLSVILFPIGLALGYYSGEVEYRLSPNLSIPFEIKYLSFGVGDDWNFESLGIGPGLRYYPAGEGMKGVFVGPYLNYLSQSKTFKYTYNPLTGETREAGISNSGISIAAWFGYRVLAGPVVIEFSTGFGYYAVSEAEVTYKDYLGVTHTETYSGTGASGFGWTGLGIGVGFAF